MKPHLIGLDDRLITDYASDIGPVAFLVYSTLVWYSDPFLEFDPGNEELSRWLSVMLNTRHYETAKAIDTLIEYGLIRVSSTEIEILPIPERIYTPIPEYEERLTQELAYYKEHVPVANMTYKEAISLPDVVIEKVGKPVSRCGKYNKLAARDGWKCHYCDRKLASPKDFNRHTRETVDNKGNPVIYRRYIPHDGFLEPQIDHVIPRSRGGLNSRDNLVLSCKSCNSSKGTKTKEEYIIFLAWKEWEGYENSK